MKEKSRFVIGSMAILVVGLVALSLLIAGSSLAQGESSTNAVPVHESLIESGMPLGWEPFPFESGLRELVDQGRISQEELDQIMTELAQRTGAVTLEASQSADGVEMIEIKINDDGSANLRGPMSETLDAAVANRLLSPEEAAAILERVDEAR